MNAPAKSSRRASQPPFWRIFQLDRAVRPPSPRSTRGWSGGAMVLGKLPGLGRPTILITVGQGPTVLAVGAGGGCLDVFTLIYPFFPLSPSLWETARYRLKYCLKGPLNPKQPTNQPTVRRRQKTRRSRYSSRKKTASRRASQPPFWQIFQLDRAVGPPSPCSSSSTFAHQAQTVNAPAIAGRGHHPCWAAEHAIS